VTEGKDHLDPYIQEQIASRSRPAVTKIRYLDFRSKYPNGLVLAVEGNDDKVVYSCWISRLAADLSFEFFVCNGKRGVRQLRNSLHVDITNSYHDVAFLVDRDFDDLSGFISTDRVFMLDRYSIENYLLDTAIIDRTVRDAFPGVGDPLSRQNICRLFEADYSLFLELSRDINYRIFLARRLSISIDDVMPSSLTSLASVSLGNVESCNISAEQAIPYDVDAEIVSAANYRAEFEALNARERYRGKFCYKFLSKWLGLLIEEFKRPKLNLFPLREDAEGRPKADELSLGSLAFRSTPPVGLGSFLQTLTTS
jgi:hypothetical protein